MQYTFFKPGGYAEFTHSTLHLISSNFLHKSDPTAQVVQIYQICNTWSQTRNDTWKVKEKKNVFFIFFIDCCHHRKLRSVQMNSVSLLLLTLHTVVYLL